VEGVRALERLVVGGQGQAALDQGAALVLVLVEAAHQDLDRGLLEVVDRPLALALAVDVAPGEPGRPLKLEGGSLALQKHRQPLEAIGDLGGDQVELEAAELLEVRELRYLRPVDPDLPA